MQTVQEISIELDRLMAPPGLHTIFYILKLVSGSVGPLEEK